MLCSKPASRHGDRHGTVNHCGKVTTVVMRTFSHCLGHTEIENLLRAHTHTQLRSVAPMYFAALLPEQHMPEETDPAGVLVLDCNGPMPGLSAERITAENVLTLLAIPSELAASGFACADTDLRSFVIRHDRWQLCNAEAIYPIGGKPTVPGPAAPAEAQSPAGQLYIEANADAQMLVTMHCVLASIAQAIDPLYDNQYAAYVDAGLMLPTHFACSVYQSMWDAFTTAWERHKPQLLLLPK